MHPTTTRAAVLAGLTLAGLVVGTPALADPVGLNQQVALADGTGQQLASSSDISGAGQVISANDRYVVFSTAAALVPEDDNDLDDVYRRDTVNRRTVLVSQRNGLPGNNYSVEPTISANGRKVAYTTWATNLTGTRDRNKSVLDVVVTNVDTGRTTRVSETTAGHQRRQNSFFPMISAQRPGRRLPVVRLLRRTRRRPSRGRLRAPARKRPDRAGLAAPGRAGRARVGPGR